jgi:hypothetical protein
VAGPLRTEGGGQNEGEPEAEAAAEQESDQERLHAIIREERKLRQDAEAEPEGEPEQLSTAEEPMVEGPADSDGPAEEFAPETHQEEKAMKTNKDKKQERHKEKNHDKHDKHDKHDGHTSSKAKKHDRYDTKHHKRERSKGKKNEKHERGTDKKYDKHERKDPPPRKSKERWCEAFVEQRLGEWSSAWSSDRDRPYYYNLRTDGAAACHGAWTRVTLGRFLYLSLAISFPPAGPVIPRPG